MDVIDTQALHASKVDSGGRLGRRYRDRICRRIDLITCNVLLGVSWPPNEAERYYVSQGVLDVRRYLYNYLLAIGRSMLGGIKQGVSHDAVANVRCGRHGSDAATPSYDPSAVK